MRVLNTQEMTHVNGGTFITSTTDYAETGAYCSIAVYTIALFSEHPLAWFYTFATGVASGAAYGLLKEGAIQAEAKWFPQLSTPVETTTAAA